MNRTNRIPIEVCKTRMELLEAAERWCAIHGLHTNVFVRVDCHPQQIVLYFNGRVPDPSAGRTGVYIRAEEFLESASLTNV
jgi:hypothetical protein